MVAFQLVLSAVANARRTFECVFAVNGALVERA